MGNLYGYANFGKRILPHQVISGHLKTTSSPVKFHQLIEIKNERGNGPNIMGQGFYGLTGESCNSLNVLEFKFSFLQDAPLGDPITSRDCDGSQNC